MRKINRIIIHCSATKSDHDIDVSDVRQWHLDRGWSDIGYHYFVDIRGNGFKGRPIEKRGAHVRGHNHDSIGICYAGGIGNDGKPKDTLTDSQRRKIEQYIKAIRAVFGEHVSVHGHNEYANKACPSFKVDKYFR
jgi:N-acetylmuramoyl-L-alanine amidase